MTPWRPWSRFGQAVAEGQGRRAYLDYAATAPFDGRLAESLKSAEWGNANALYVEGRAAFAQLEDARRRIARALGAHEPSEIYFTSGGTESDNTALSGLASEVPGAARTHVIVSAIEHDAVLMSARALKKRGFAVDVLKPNGQGILTPEILRERLEGIEQKGEATCLVAVQAVNNELGTIQPVSELADIAHGHGARFFSDMVQALGKLELDLEASGVDAAAFSAHKIGALKGCGALYVRRNVRCLPYLFGGGQEAGLRSGTQNVPGAHVFAAAVELACAEREQVWERVSGFRAQVLEAVQSADVAHALRPTVPESDSQVPHILSFLCDGLEGETIVLRADNAGIAVSAGSACSSKSLDPSHVMTALGIPKDEAYGSLRISFGAGTTQSDIDQLCGALGEVLR